MQFHCPQHQCADCEQKTGDAGGMIYRCRWCERGYCEDCLDFEKTDLLGDSLKEFKLLGFPAVTQAFFIRCPSCKHNHTETPSEGRLCDELARAYDKAFVIHQAQSEGADDSSDLSEAAASSPISVGSLTDGTTRDSSGITTPSFDYDGFEIVSATKSKNKNKRKAECRTDKLSPGSAKRPLHRFSS